MRRLAPIPLTGSRVMGQLSSTRCSLDRTFFLLHADLYLLVYNSSRGALLLPPTVPWLAVPVVVLCLFSALGHLTAVVPHAQGKARA